MDRVLLLLCLLLIGGVWLMIQMRVASGPTMAMIYQGDRLLASYPLPQPGQLPIHFEAEGPIGLTEILIDQHGARITSSPCNTQQCVLSGAHRHAGDMIACVPNRILVSIQGQDASRFDAIVE